jgi:hypothetical protein
MKKTMVAVVMLTVGLTQLAYSSRSQMSGTDACSMAMKHLEDRENLHVSPDARDLIGSSFKDWRVKLLELGGESGWKGSSRTLNETLVIYYLEDLRDLKAAKEFGGIGTPVPMNQDLADRGETSATGRWQKTWITVADVRAYPVEDFLTKVTPVLKGPKGELHVISEPTSAAITLDKATRGNTEKITVETAGDHQIRVTSQKGGLSCNDRITIPPGGSVTFHCP